MKLRMMNKRVAWSRASRPPEELRERLPGQIILLFAIFSVVLIGFLALAIDAGYLMSKRREVQNAADAAALAAAVASLNGASEELTEDTALAYALLNADVSADDVTVSIPPTSGPNAGDSDFIQVTVETDVAKFFLGVVYTGDWEVGASATAGIIVDGTSTGLLALNPSAGGIVTSGSTTITVEGASIISNYNINVSGNTHLTATDGGKIMANDGVIKSGSSTFSPTENGSAPEVPDPLLDLIDPPTLPSTPGNPVPVVPNYDESTACFTEPQWSYTPPATPVYAAYPGQFTGGGSCITIQNPEASTWFEFVAGEYKFIGGAGVSVQRTRTRINGGTWNFNGGHLTATGDGSVVMCAGDYSFVSGSKLRLTGNTPNNHIGGGSGCSGSGTSNFYFSGSGSGIEGSGMNGITLYPGRYIFNGGAGFNMSGNASLTFQPGEYEFWFNGGADMTFSGSSRIASIAGAHVEMYFSGSGGNQSELNISGNTNFNIPSGEYYFDNGRLAGSGSLWIYGEEVFLYFKNGSRLETSGSADFSFTAPTSMIYPGYYPGVFMYSDRANTATFTWTGRSDNESRGIVYLPSSPLAMSGAGNAKMFTGQLIVDRLITSGNQVMSIEYEEFVSTEVPAVYLVN